MLAALVFSLIIVGLMDVADGFVDVVRFVQRMGYDNWTGGTL